MKNNKGFSLVELVIVIAIMAILVGVIAPAIIKYIDKARTSKCRNDREVIRLEFEATFAGSHLDYDNPTAVEKVLNDVLTERGYKPVDDGKIEGLCRYGGTVTYDIEEGRMLIIECDKHKDD